MPLVTSACFCIFTFIVFLIFLPEPGRHLPKVSLEVASDEQDDLKNLVEAAEDYEVEKRIVENVKRAKYAPLHSFSLH